MPEQKLKSLRQRLELKEFKLNSLLEITTAINENFSIDKLIKIYEYILREQLGITKLALYNNNTDEWNTLLRYGAKGLAKKIDVERDLLHIKEITVIESSSNPALNSFDIAIPVLHKNFPLAFLLIGDLEEEDIMMSAMASNMPFIQTLTNIIMVAIENKRFANKSIAQELTNKELEVAAQMQAMLLPSNLPSNNRIEVGALYESLQLIGGDYYDFIKLNNEEFVFCIADVSGKGIPAALLMSNFQANLRANVKYNHHQLSMEDLIVELNKNVNDAAQGEKFITFFFAYYNCTTRTLKYVNAGHNHPILFNGGQTEDLGKGCIGLGMFDEIPHIDVGVVEIEPNSMLVCFTDGLVELENAEGEQFETERLKQIVSENNHLKINELNKLIFLELDRFKGDLKYLDDTAILSCRFF
ncbi:MAG: PP2C family protein-serine/threonine phosphatase [Flavobacteriales bacterium]|jgi:sigma-B regulation protein RsbU (phosphoserine phosphatase)|nr:PP2C family protein-serine/threonine phosphatase [Flavobacteriales bacterium]